MTDQSCKRHQWEVQADQCESCGHGYCAGCLVYVRGTSNPPMCVQCALSRSGIRTGARSPRKTWRERRREAKLRKATTDAVRNSRLEAQAHAAGADLGGTQGIADPDQDTSEPSSVGSWASVDVADERSA